MTWIPNQKSIPVLQQDSCSRCAMSLPPGTVFCPRCGPPEPPDEVHQETLSSFKAVLFIGIILILFSGVVVYKQKGSVKETVDELVGNEKTTTSTVDPEDRPQDKDFQLAHYINVPFANLRSNATTNSRVVTVLKKGQKVKIIYKGDSWSQIEVGEDTGWIANYLLESKVE